MTDKTKCPHCGAAADEFGNGKWFDCGSVVGQQSVLCEVRTLRAKVAAQQELLRHVRGNLLGYQPLGSPELVRRIEDLLCD